jgi:hypothetical protein
MDEGESQYWDKIDRAISDASEARDRTIVTLSTSALGGSIALFHLVFDQGKHPLAVWLAWAMFAGSAVAALLSMETAEFSLRWAQRQLIKRKKLDERWPGGAWAKATWVLNRWAVWSFVFGIGFVLWFVFVNVKGG